MTEVEPRLAARLAHCKECHERCIHTIAEDIINLWRFTDLLPNRAILYLNELMVLDTIDEDEMGKCLAAPNPTWMQLISDFLTLIQDVHEESLDGWKIELQMMVDRRLVRV